jgi:uncharacterized protein (TIGR03435 family)
VGLSATVAAVAAAKGATATTSTLTLTKGILKLMAWTKMKTAIVVGVGVLFAAGTTVTVTHVMTRVPDDSWRAERINSQSVAQLAPQVRILPTKFPHPGNLTGGGPGKFVGIGRPVADIVEIAYDWPHSRIVFAADAPPERYDFVATLRQGSLEALQQELKKQLGFVGQVESRDVDVLLLKVRNQGAPGLKPPTQGQGFYMAHNGINHQIKIDNQPIAVAGGPNHGAGLANFLEIIFKMPVIDQTGLKGHYSIDLKWTEPAASGPDHDAIKRELLDELGFELVPGHQTVDMLVMEKNQ